VGCGLKKSGRCDRLKPQARNLQCKGRPLVGLMLGGNPVLHVGKKINKVDALQEKGIFNRTGKEKAGVELRFKGDSS